MPHSWVLTSNYTRDPVEALPLINNISPCGFSSVYKRLELLTSWSPLFVCKECYIFETYKFQATLAARPQALSHKSCSVEEKKWVPVSSRPQILTARSQTSSQKCGMLSRQRSLIVWLSDLSLHTQLNGIGLISLGNWLLGEKNLKILYLFLSFLGNKKPVCCFPDHRFELNQTNPLEAPK